LILRQNEYPVRISSDRSSQRSAQRPAALVNNEADHRIENILRRNGVLRGFLNIPDPAGRQHQGSPAHGADARESANSAKDAARQRPVDGGR